MKSSSCRLHNEIVPGQLECSLKAPAGVHISCKHTNVLSICCLSTLPSICIALNKHRLKSLLPAFLNPMWAKQIDWVVYSEKMLWGVTYQGFDKAGRTMASAQHEPLTEPLAVLAGRSPVGDHGGSPEAESLLFILYKRGSKVKDSSSPCPRQTDSRSHEQPPNFGLCGEPCPSMPICPCISLHYDIYTVFQKNEAPKFWL